MSANDISDEDALKYLTAAVASGDKERILWSDELVKRANFLWSIGGDGKIPTVDQVAQTIGIDRAQQMLPKILERRRFLNVLHAYKSPCHYCGSDSDLVAFDFGLMRVKATARAWGETAATAALAAITFPMFGAAMVKLPGQTSKGEILALRLIVCKTCCAKEGNFFGLFLSLIHI